MDGLDRWASFPKVELHTHLDCSIGYEAAQRLTPSLSVEEFERDFVAPPRCRDLAEFLSCVAPSVGLMQSETALRLSVRSLYQQLVADGVIYAELRFAPLLHLESLSPEAVIETVLSEMADQAAEHSVRSGLILCTLRHFDESQSLRTAELVRRYASAGVVALDIAGDEAGYSLEPHRKAFRAVKDSPAGATAHAGEALGPASVWDTLRELEPDRIGHGVRSIDEDRLVDHLAASGVHLEVCPAVNVQIQLYPDLANHPVEKLRSRGVPLSINTDGRIVVGTNLREDYLRLEEAFGWDQNTFCEINHAAAAASFAGDDDKAWMRDRVGSAAVDPLDGETHRASFR